MESLTTVAVATMTTLVMAAVFGFKMALAATGSHVADAAARTRGLVDALPRAHDLVLQRPPPFSVCQHR